MKKTCIIFDFDGVLVESESKSFVFLADTLLAKHKIVLDPKLAPSKVGMPTSVFIEKNLSDRLSVQEMKELYQLYKKATIENIEKYITPHEQVIDFIRSASVAYTIGIASMNTTLYLEAVLEYFDLTKAVTKLLSRDDVERNKPDPEIYFSMLQALHCTAKQAIVLEDSLPCVEAANRANIDCLGVLNEYNARQDFSSVNTVGLIHVDRFADEIARHL